MPNYDLYMELVDSTTSTEVYTLTLKKERMTIDGKYFGMPGKCVLPVFGDFDKDGNVNDNTDNFYLGSHAMYEEYVVYDNTPIKANPADPTAAIAFPQIGLGKIKAGVHVTTPLSDLYLSGTGADQTIKETSLLSDSAVYNPTIDSDDEFMVQNSGGDFFAVKKPINPINPDKPSDGGDSKSWLEKNLVLVIVMIIVMIGIIGTLVYFTCIKKKSSYANALYDDDKLMKARI